MELNLDFDSEEIQVHNIDSINQFNEKYKKERNKTIIIDKVSKEQNVDFDFFSYRTKEDV